MSHPRLHAPATPDKPALVMSDASPGLTYAELEGRANQGAQLIHSLGLRRGDAVAYWLPNCSEVFELYWAAQRAGLYVVPVASALTAGEAAYIVENSGAKLVVVAPELPDVSDLVTPQEVRVLTREQWGEAIARQPASPIADESPGTHMV